MIVMLDAIVTSGAQTLTAKPYTRERVAPASVLAQPASVSPSGFVSSSIRVDNLQNVAILEFRTEEGEILQQYPSQSQIEAFHRARTLERRTVEISSSPSPDTAHTTAAVPTPAPVTNGEAVSTLAVSAGSSGATSVVV